MLLHDDDHVNVSFGSSSSTVNLLQRNKNVYKPLSVTVYYHFEKYPLLSMKMSTYFVLVIYGLILVHCHDDECSHPYRRVGEGCYLIQKDTVSGDAAFAKCLLLGASLANFDTLNEAMLMKHELVRLNTGVHYFIGGRNIDRYKSGGDWRWIRKNGDMVKMTYFAFDSAEPDGTVSRSEDCMFFYAPRKYKFHAVWCENGSLLGGYICQK
ncbi:uncharacterized protein [Mytilus edulis]|uniref:uncharacterized protein isoform X1 n=1 Tax=Mytilus edulis TaxID=6550 RepID=UPI0039EF7C79